MYVCVCVGVCVCVKVINKYFVACRVFQLWEFDSEFSIFASTKRCSKTPTEVHLVQ